MSKSLFEGQLNAIAEATHENARAQSEAKDLVGQAEQLRTEGLNGWYRAVDQASQAIVDAAQDVSPAEVVGAYLDLKERVKEGALPRSNRMQSFGNQLQRLMSNGEQTVDKIGIMATISAMHKGEPALGLYTQTPSGILTGEAKIKIKQRKTGINPRHHILYPGFDLVMPLRTIDEGKVAPRSKNVETEIFGLNQRYAIGHLAVQELISGTMYKVGYESDSCGAHHSSYKTDNFSTLKQYLESAEAMAAAGLELDVTNLQAVLDEATNTKNRNYIKNLQNPRRRRTQGFRRV